MFYSDVIQLPNFKARYEALRLKGKVGFETFGYDRYINQRLYQSNRWRKLRNALIIRDRACDLAIDGYELKDHIILHHIQPVTVDDILNGNSNVFDPENLICCSHKTHNAIHYGDERLIFTGIVKRAPGDTKLW